MTANEFTSLFCICAQVRDERLAMIIVALIGPCNDYSIYFIAI